MSDPCIPCEQHAELHKGNRLGLGSANDPCAQCEQHAKMHAADGCALLFTLLTATAAVVIGGVARSGRSKN